MDEFKERRAKSAMKERFDERSSLAFAFRLLDVNSEGFITFDVFLNFIQSMASQKRAKKMP